MSIHKRPIQFGFQVEEKGARPPLIDQVHGSDIREISDRPSEVIPADAVITRELEKAIYVFTADCLPVLFYDEEPAGTIGAVHAGWRGTKLGVVKKTYERIAPGATRLHAVFGPCLKSCCFEVKEDFIAEFSAERPYVKQYLENRDGKKFFDLVGFVIERELSEMSKDDIDLSMNKCTYCSIPALPSYRRNKQTNPRICSFIKKVVYVE